MVEGVQNSTSDDASVRFVAICMLPYRLVEEEKFHFIPFHFMLDERIA
jgi:hypothetical protein